MLSGWEEGNESRSPGNRGNAGDGSINHNGGNVTIPEIGGHFRCPGAVSVILITDVVETEQLIKRNDKRHVGRICSQGFSGSRWVWTKCQQIICLLR